jgi:hypothetical protein
VRVITASRFVASQAWRNYVDLQPADDGRTDSAVMTIDRSGRIA